MSALCLGAVLVTLTTLACAEPPRPSDNDNGRETACPVRNWTSPQSLGRAARFPSVATGKTGSYVVGNDIGIFDASPVRTSPLTAWKLGVGDVGKPAGSFDYVMPRAVLDEVGTLHVMWAEPAQVGAQVVASEWPPVPLTTLWSASLDPTGRWSTPERAYTASAISWESASVLAGVDVAEIMVTAARSIAGEPVIVIVHLESEGWRVREIPHRENPGGAGYPTLASRSGSLYLAYTAAASGTAHDVNSVFVRRSADSGETWGDPIIVSRSGDHPAFEPRLSAGADGALDIVWFQTLTSDLTVVRHVRSSDGALTWSRPADLGAPAEHHGLRSVRESCGALHLVYEEWSQDIDKRRLIYVVHESGWSQPRALFDSLVSLDADIQTDQTGEPLLVFHGRPVAEAANSPFNAFLSGLK